MRRTAPDGTNTDDDRKNEEETEDVYKKMTIALTPGVSDNRQ